MALETTNLEHFGQAGVTQIQSQFGPSFERLRSMGLGADVLPVVCDQNAPRSPNSRLHAIGKVPSIVNGRGEVVGIPSWTHKQSTDAEIKTWANDPLLGVALQGRTVRGLDIDVENHRIASAIADRFEQEIQRKLPKRGRSNSAKILLAMMMRGMLKKRSFKCEGGLVELLGSGQQFIVDSIHPSGVRYEWEGEFPSEFPEVSVEDLDRAWKAIVTEFALPPARSNRNQSDRAFADPRESWLLDNWENHGIGSNGYLNIECPFKGYHSADSGPSECSYLPAGTNGYAHGRYKCFHASCDGRSQDEFDRATGYDRVGQADGQFVEWPADIVPTRGGAIPATLQHVVSALGLVPLCGGTLVFDAFLGEVLLQAHNGEFRLFDDDERSMLRLRLETAGFRPIKREDLREAIRIVAKRNGIDSARDWLQSLRWDGVERVERFFPTYMGADDDQYTRAVSIYLWTALAGRTLYPGCQADMVPILSSPEGRGKSTTLQAIPPAPSQFVEIDLHHRDENLSRLMKGKDLGEIAELRGLQRRDVEAIKAFVTRRWEEWTPKYIEKPVRYDRRLTLVGTTNEEQFLGANTGERRWLPLIVDQCNRDLVVADRDQLWAEAAATVKNRVQEDLDPVAWEGAYKLAPTARNDFQAEDWFEARILSWLATEEGRRLASEGVSIDCILPFVLGGQARCTPYEQSRLAQALRSCGFRQDRKRVGAKRPRVWRLEEPAS